MTIAKMWRCLGAMLVLCALLLTACSKKEPADPFEELIPTTDATETQAAVSYRVVVPHSCSAELYEAAEGLAEKISAQTGYLCTLVYDREAVGHPSSVIEILLGAVERDGVSERLKGLRGDDYLCCFLGDSLLLGGAADDATCRAIERFCQDILPAATAEQLMHPYGGFEHRGTYAGIYLNGFELSEYRIVLCQGSEQLRPLAQILQDELSALGSYEPAILSADEDDGIGRCIYLELSEQSSTAYLFPVQRGIRLRASEAYGVSVAVVQLLERLTAGKEGDALYRLTLTQSEAFSYVLPQYRVASLYARHLIPFGGLSDILSVSETLKQYLPDVALLADLTGTGIQSLDDNLPDHRGQTDTAATPVPIYACGTSVDSVTCTQNAGLSVSVCRLGASHGLTLVVISGDLTEDHTLRLADLLDPAVGRVAVLLHTSVNTGTLTLSDGSDYGLLEQLSVSYLAEDIHYTLRGFANDRALTLRVKHQVDAAGYVEVEICRLSVFS